MTKIAILGGGVAGLTCAHELAELGLGFEIHVYEATDAIGGKARSQFIAGTGKDGRRELPGEHGFRFFPAWYAHIPQTMRRIPMPGGGTVADNLRGCGEFGLADADEVSVIPMPRQRPETPGDYLRIIETTNDFMAQANLRNNDIARFSLKMLRFLLTCEERRRAELERISFYDYVEGDRYSERFRRYVNSTRFMVAMDARKGSACTVGGKVIQLFLDFRRPAGANDRVLDGPTSLRWLEPWERHLRSLGVHIHLHRPVEGLQFDEKTRRITGARLQGEAEPIEADYFILAAPVERVQGLIDDKLAAADESLATLRRAEQMTSWMVGAQYFLRKDVQLCKGHVAYPDSSWALSSISQASFWNAGKPEAEHFHNVYGDGTIAGVLSVDISDWFAASDKTGKCAADCANASEVLDEVWRQLKEGANGRSSSDILLRDEDVVYRHLDENVTFGSAGTKNRWPLLVHPPGSWYSRPHAVLAGIENMFLAGDYVQTTTDLASMEGANESARFAVNGLLEKCGRSERAEVFPIREEAGPLVEKMKAFDKRAFDRGDEWRLPLTWKGDEDMSVQDAVAFEHALFNMIRQQS